MISHKEFSARVRKSRPCAAYHLTFGGKCLNCGYDPEYLETVELEFTRKEVFGEEEKDNGKRNV